MQQEVGIETDIEVTQLHKGYYVFHYGSLPLPYSNFSRRAAQRGTTPEAPSPLSSAAPLVQYLDAHIQAAQRRLDERLAAIERRR